MRRLPDLEGFERIILEAPNGERRWRDVLAAGPIHERGDFVFQVVGEEPDIIGKVLARVTDRGKVPEALRLAHLIGGAVILGESGRRA